MVGDALVNRRLLTDPIPTAKSLEEPLFDNGQSPAFPLPGSDLDHARSLRMHHEPILSQLLFSTRSADKGR